MLLWKTFRYSCLHFFIVTMLFSISFFNETKRRKVDDRIFSAHLHHFVFG